MAGIRIKCGRKQFAVCRYGGPLECWEHVTGQQHPRRRLDFELTSAEIRKAGHSILNVSRFRVGCSLLSRCRTALITRQPARDGSALVSDAGIGWEANAKELGHGYLQVDSLSC